MKLIPLCGCDMWLVPCVVHRLVHVDIRPTEELLYVSRPVVANRRDQRGHAITRSLYTYDVRTQTLPQSERPILSS